MNFKKLGALLVLALAVVAGIFFYTRTVPGPKELPAATVDLDTRYRVDKAELRLLVDISHSHPMTPGASLDKTHFDYYDAGNWERLLRHLSRLGVSVDILHKGKLSAELLSQYNLFCLYFPSDDGQVLSPTEVEVIEKWTRDGGGLFVVGEHSNASNSAKVLNPLLQRFGMELPYATLVDPKNTFAFDGWDKQRRFSRHPITEGIGELALATTGAIVVKNDHPDHPIGLSRSSDEAYLDSWDPSKGKAGFAGDFVWQSQEPKGSFFGLAAATPGQGRVVVIGDHNAFSNIFLHYADNLALAVQAWNWLSDGRLESPDEEVSGDPNQEFTILMPETTRPSNIMSHPSFAKGATNNAYFTLYVALNRDSRVSVRCTSRLEGSFDAVMIAPQKERFTKGFLDFVSKARQNGSLIIIMVDTTPPVKEGTDQLLELFQIDLGQPGTTKSGKVEFSVLGDQIGQSVVNYHEWPQVPGKVVMSLTNDQQNVFPAIVEPKPGVQVFLQGPIVRNDSFRTENGHFVIAGSSMPNKDALVIYRALWAWLNSLL